jgi:hypothetical protein
VLEAIMAIVVVAGSLFFAMMIGLVMIAIAVRREDRAFTLVGDAPGWVSRGVRRMNGVGRRDLDPELFRPAGKLAH